MSVQSEAADPGAADAEPVTPKRETPENPLLAESVTALFTHLDDVIQHAANAHELSQQVADDNAAGALGDAISLLDHVRTRLQYDFALAAPAEITDRRRRRRRRLR